MRLKLLLLVLCSLSLFLVSHVDTAYADAKVVTPFLELKPNSIELSPMPPKVGPGGEGEITITFTQK